MHLTSFGLISLKGSVTKPEPGLGFAEYQTAMVTYSASVALQSRIGKDGKPAASRNTIAPPAPSHSDISPDKDIVPRANRSAASALVRKFRA